MSRRLAMQRTSSLPLGVDVGTHRTRIALTERGDDGTVRLVAAAVAPTAGDPAAALTSALAELPTRERRCVLAVRAPLAQLRVIDVPNLSRRERERAARFEALHGLGYTARDAVVRIIALEDGRCVIAVAPLRALAGHEALARGAGLRIVAIDDAAFALRRCVPDDIAILDIGSTASLLVLHDDPIPHSGHFPFGGQSVNDTIARNLGIDDGAAERRKRTVGIGGAGESHRDSFVAAVAAAMGVARAESRGVIRGLAVSGNGSRLIGLTAALEAVLAIPVTTLTLPASVSTTVPPDVLRSAAPDWALAYGLALWETVA